MNRARLEAIIPTAAILLSLSLAASLGAAEPKLKIGDDAPAMQVAKWFKGGPVAKFEPGQVYVVEFWATWCGPCKQSIPHLTELAKKFDGKAHIIGVSIWESEKTDHAKRLATVAKFVEGMGEKMNYGVAADDNEAFMARNWMEAADEGGIPTAFIVGKDGKIAWIGYPWGGLDQALEQTVAGTLDPKAVQAEAAERQRLREARNKERELLKPVSDLQAQKKPAEAMAALDKLVEEHPELAGKTGYLRYKLLMGYDQPAAYRQVRKMLDGELKNNASGLYGIARDLTDPPGPKTKDWDLALAVSQRACDLSKFANPSYLATLSEAYAGKGNYPKAIETMELALSKAAADNSLPESSKRYLQRRLQAIKAAQEKAASPIESK
jgi:thiol-disulfide isomerase/thioredoxin